MTSHLVGKHKNVIEDAQKLLRNARKMLRRSLTVASIDGHIDAAHLVKAGLSTSEIGTVLDVVDDEGSVVDDLSDDHEIQDIFCLLPESFSHQQEERRSPLLSS